MVIENLPCDCLAIGTLGAIAGLLFNQLSYGSGRYAEEDYIVACSYSQATYEWAGNREQFSYFDFDESDTCFAENARNNVDIPVAVCDFETWLAGLIFLVGGIIATCSVVMGVQAQAPKFARKKKWTFRLAVLFSGFLYVGSGYVWFKFTKCKGYQALTRSQAYMGWSWYLVTFGGMLNIFAGMLSFINPEEHISATKKRIRNAHQQRMSSQVYNGGLNITQRLLSRKSMDGESDAITVTTNQDTNTNTNTTDS